MFHVLQVPCAAVAAVDSAHLTHLPDTPSLLTGYTHFLTDPLTNGQNWIQDSSEFMKFGYKSDKI